MQTNQLTKPNQTKSNKQRLDCLYQWKTEGGPKLALVGDFDERLSTIVDNLGLTRYFDAIVSSREAGGGLPSPHIFKEVMARTSVSDRKKVLHFGWNFQKDVVGAAAAGIQPCWQVIPSYDVLEPELEALQISHLRTGDLSTLLDRYGKLDTEEIVTTTYKDILRPPKGTTYMY